MPDEVIWHDFDARHRALKVAFVGEYGVAVFTYRPCPDCGVSMDRTEIGDGILWTCQICGCEVREFAES